MAQTVVRIALALSLVQAGTGVAGDTPAAPTQLAMLGHGLNAQIPAQPGSAAVVDLVTPLPRVLTLDLTRDANDIWDRIRRGFAMADLDNERVAHYEQFYLERPRFLQQVFTRGGRYLYHIINELEQRGLPAELALLPMVESNYNPLAYSRAHASGLWQFIPSTGRHYSLTQDKWVDERRDIVASTDAALSYLQHIYEMHGDWHLALASYNWGEGSVGRARQRNESAGLPTEYRDLRMPSETANYVPKLQALKNIVLNPERFGFELPYVPNRPHFVTVESPVGVDLATAAHLAEMSIEDFVALNPAFNRPVITRAGHQLVVPVSVSERFVERLQALAESAPGWTTYRLKRGETLESVARRHRLTVTQLRELNGLGSRVRVTTGHALLVPDGADPRGALAAASTIPLQVRAAAHQNRR